MHASLLTFLPCMYLIHSLLHTNSTASRNTDRGNYNGYAFESESVTHKVTVLLYIHWCWSVE